MKKTQQAFTLIELLVVITIIAILASIALPVYGSIQIKGNQTKALAQAKQVGLALRLFAGDNDGNYPQQYDAANDSSNFAEPPATANEAFRQLIPDYVNGEKIFYVAKSGWTLNAPDENISGDAKLEGGENHWAYVPKLNDTSNPNFPLIADGFSETIGVYTNDDTERGGVWKGTRAIVVRNDQSAGLERLDRDDFTVMAKIGGTTQEDIFSTSSNGGSWIPEAPVNPEE